MHQEQFHGEVASGVGRGLQSFFGDGGEACGSVEMDGVFKFPVGFEEESGGRRTEVKRGFDSGTLRQLVAVLEA